MSFGPQSPYKQVNDALDTTIGYRGNWNFRIGCEQQSHAVDHLRKCSDDLCASNYSEYASPSTQPRRNARACQSKVIRLLDTWIVHGALQTGIVASAIPCRERPAVIHVHTIRAYSMGLGNESTLTSVTSPADTETFCF